MGRCVCVAGRAPTPASFGLFQRLSCSSKGWPLGKCEVQA